MPETCTAAVLEKIAQPLKLKTVPIPKTVPGAATVRVLATVLSPNVKDVFAGAFGPISVGTPVIPSMASIARIHSAGGDATVLKPGQLVFTDFWTQSRDDPDDSILAGYMGGNDILESVWNNGTFAEYASVPLERVWPLDESLLCEKLGYTVAELAYLGNICISFGGLMTVNVLPGDSVVVAPATGTFGGAAVHAAVAMGAKVIACGRNDQMLSRIAEAFSSSGRLTTVKLSEDVNEDVAAIRAAAGGKGADKFVDFSPTQATGSKLLAAGISALRPNGRVAIVGGILQNVEIPYFTVMRNNIRIEGRYMFDRMHVLQAIKLLESGQLVIGDRPNSGMKVHSFKLTDWEQALDTAAECRGWGNMVVLEP
ncbi:hypothetical protein H2200_013631 [Cladophialophora chaetospira]|uniref:Alcohol dehydrogenase n=1 Tax=Cladophialophora chaetospira TaxID=386627 RepID=A0AA38WP76_9EURO|nr:hypothetical protein H2200_013631 [Cladophialophora chaetospira]